MTRPTINDILANEQWKGVPNFPGYEASNHGRVRSLDRLVESNEGIHAAYNRFFKGRVLKPYKQKNGYHIVHLGVGNRKTVHRIIALTWIGDSPKGLGDINHKNGIKTDNRPENLEWSNKSLNGLHYHRVLKRKSHANIFIK